MSLLNDNGAATDARLREAPVQTHLRSALYKLSADVFSAASGSACA